MQMCCTKRKYSVVQFPVALPRIARQKMRSFCNIIKASKVKLSTTTPCLNVLESFINPYTSLCWYSFNGLMVNG